MPDARTRHGFLYSRSGFAWDAAGAAPVGIGSDLYRLRIGDTDPAIGVLDLSDTNMVTAGQLDSAQAFDGHMHGFRLSVFDAASVTAANQQLALAVLVAKLAARWQMGRETAQDFGRVLDSLLVTPAHQANGTGEQVAQAPVGAMQRVGPIMEMGRGTSISMEIRQSTRGTALPNGVGLEDLVLSLDHTWFGMTHTVIGG